MRADEFPFDPDEGVAYIQRTSRGYKRRLQKALAEARTGEEITHLIKELREVEYLEAQGLTRD
jgi:hypothetical protein